MTADPRMADLVKAGKIRAALFLPQYAKDAATGAVRGLGIGYVAIEFAGALAAKLGIERIIVAHPTPPSALAALKSGACDMVMLGIEPSRVAEFDFTPSIVQFDYAFLVPPGSPVRRTEGFDRPGFRIAVVRNHASTLALTRLTKQAELIGSDVPDPAFELLKSGQVDAFAAPREVLLDYAATLPGSRVLDDSYGVNNVGIAVAKGRTARLGYIAEFAEEAKRSGLIAQIISRGALRGFRVAPPA